MENNNANKPKEFIIKKLQKNPSSSQVGFKKIPNANSINLYNFNMQASTKSGAGHPKFEEKPSL
jgi:hypothetical protein